MNLTDTADLWWKTAVLYCADVQTFLDLDGEDDSFVRVTNPHLYLGNPLMGSGFVTEEPLHGVVQIRRGDLKTDRDAFGYSIEKIYGGVNVSSFEAEVAAVPTEEDSRVVEFVLACRGLAPEDVCS